MSMQLAVKFFVSVAVICYALGFMTFFWYYFKQEELKAFKNSIKSHLKNFQDWLIIHWKYFKKRFGDVIHLMLLRSKEVIVPIIAHINGEDIPEEIPIPTPEPTEAQALPWYEREAKRLGVIVNPNTEIRDTVLEGLERNKAKYGARYCPCMNPSYYGNGKQSSDLVCTCYKMRHNKICHCGLFVSNTAFSHPGMKYETQEDGSIGLVPMDGTEGPISPAERTEGPRKIEETVTEEVKTE